MKHVAASLAFLVSFAAAPASAQLMLGPADDVEAALNALSPGDEVVLADGMYTLTSRFSFSAVGTSAAPILIRAADGARPHFHRPDASQNIWDITNAEHVTLRGLTFSGGSAGLRVSGATDFTIEDCEIFETEDVALRMNDGTVTYTRISILRNHIHDTGGTGEGMYLGCNEDGCRLAGCLIEGNYVHHTNAGDVSQGDGIELKEGSHSCVIRGNVIHDTNYPCILGYSTVGGGAPNLIEDNAMWNCGDHAIQWAADATIQNNIVLGAGANGIATQPHQNGAPSNLVIVHNTVLAPSNDALSVRNATGTVVVANNALYSQSGRALLVIGDASMITVAGNVGVGAVEGVTGGFTIGDLGVDFLGASFGGGLPNDVFPAAGGGLVASGDVAHVISDDFNATPRMGVADVGAYAFGEGTNPGWMLAEDFRPAPSTRPGLDGGTPGLDAGARRDGGGLPGADGSPPDRDAGPGGAGDGGCGCRATGGDTRSGWLALLLVGSLLMGRRRTYISLQ